MQDKKQQLKENLSRVKGHLAQGSTWMRAVYMVIFCAILFFTWYVVLFVILFQFGTMLLMGSTNLQVLAFSQRLNLYIYDILAFLSYETDEKPFPFRAFPSANG